MAAEAAAETAKTDQERQTANALKSAAEAIRNANLAKITAAKAKAEKIRQDREELGAKHK
jgi:hypothetical protein